MAENSHSASVKRGLPEDAEAFRGSVCTAFFPALKEAFFYSPAHGHSRGSCASSPCVDLFIPSTANTVPY